MTTDDTTNQPTGTPADDAPANAYQARQDAKRDRLRERADATRAAADAAHATADRMADAIPFGQPILVGHHSESRDRRYRQRIHDTQGRAFDLDRKADRLAERADRVGTAGISSDDPDAVDKLRAKLAEMNEARDTMKRRNALIRKHARAGHDAQLAALVADGMDNAAANNLLTPQFGRRGYTFTLTNLTANAKRVEQRITELEAARTSPPVEGGRRGRCAACGQTVTDAAGTWVDDTGSDVCGTAGGNQPHDPADVIEWGEDRDMNRVWIAFPAKPGTELRARLRSAGFRWAPSLGRWQRHTSNAAIYHARQIVEAERVTR